MNKPKSILIIAGDPSGDRHAAVLAQELKKRDPTLHIAAAGGRFLREAADEFLYPLVDVGGFGFWEPIKAIPRLLKLRKRLAAWMDAHHPSAVIPVDYYGFNIHVARTAKARSIPVFYYISPQVWASRPHRIQELKKAVTRMLVIFPFEEKLYQDAGVPATFVGHPLLKKCPDPQTASSEPTVGLFPGSRPHVFRRHFPVLMETAALLHEKNAGLKFILFKAKEISEDELRSYSSCMPWVEIAEDPTYEKRSRLWLAVGVSGTASLENMLMGIPMVIMYRLSWLTYQIAKRLIRVPYIGIPNLLAGRRVVPELLQEDANPAKLATEALILLENESARSAMRQNLLTLRQTLEPSEHTQSKAADTILQSL